MSNHLDKKNLRPRPQGNASFFPFHDADVLECIDSDCISRFTVNEARNEATLSIQKTDPRLLFHPPDDYYYILL